MTESMRFFHEDWRSEGTVLADLEREVENVN